MNDHARGKNGFFIFEGKNAVFKPF